MPGNGVAKSLSRLQSRPLPLAGIALEMESSSAFSGLGGFRVSGFRVLGFRWFRVLEGLGFYGSGF